ncbi:MAG: phosphotransferase [Gammaproteobacteria bacterium]|nr:phosphotransferase [Gammaproteobacteria bacterium]
MMTQRTDAIQNWLQEKFGMTDAVLSPITNDASFRRYFRVAVDGVHRIVMDAPPDKEPCAPFVDVARRLRDSGLNAPEILAADLEQGFLLLTDLGDQRYLDALSDEEHTERLYGDALSALVAMQACTPMEGLPRYNRRLLHMEMDLFKYWLLGAHLGILLNKKEKKKLKACFKVLSASALSQPRVFVHRDYHSRNLMVMPKHNPGILDFQDAVQGPITYDLVSLLRDCYIVWPRQRVIDWVLGYHDLAVQSGVLAEANEERFLRWFDLMGIQRHVKVAGIFTRLYRRDRKDAYLKDIPTALRYIVEAGADYPELEMLHFLVEYTMLPRITEPCLAESLLK